MTVKTIDMVVLTVDGVCEKETIHLVQKRCKEENY